MKALNFFLASILGISSAYSAPRLLPFQGYLNTTAGQSVDDGARTVQFKIYDSPVSGSTVWAGEVHKLTVNKGLVNTILGTKTSFPETYAGGQKVTFSEPLYVEITVDTNNDGQITAVDPPLLPRQVLLPANFAHVAQSVRSTSGNEVISPSGVIDGSQVKENSIPGASIQSLPLSKLDDGVGTGGIVSSQIAENAVGTSELADNSINTGHLQDGNITEAKLDPSGFSGSLVKPDTLSPDRLSHDFAILWDEKAYDEDGGASVNGLQTRQLNKSTILGNSISLLGNQITLKAGTYMVEASAPAFYSNRHQIYLRRVRDSFIQLTGTSEHTTSPGSQTRSYIKGIVEIDNEETFDIRHYTRTDRGTDGLGRSLSGYAASFTPVDRPSIYTQVYIQRLK